MKVPADLGGTSFKVSNAKMSSDEKEEQDEQRFIQARRIRIFLRERRTRKKDDLGQPRTFFYQV
jgi:hypothetical protein